MVSPLLFTLVAAPHGYARQFRAMTTALCYRLRLIPSHPILVSAARLRAHDVDEGLLVQSGGLISLVVVVQKSPAQEPRGYGGHEEASGTPLAHIQRVHLPDVREDPPRSPTGGQGCSCPKYPP